MSRVKICGLTCEEDVAYVNEAKADFAGFILFFQKSKRYVTLEQAVRLKEKLDPQIRPVAVTVSPSREQLEQIEESGFPIVQIHGDWDAKDAGTYLHIPVWRAFQMEPDGTGEQLAGKLRKLDAYPYAGVVLDGYRVGSGEVFDWTAVKEYTAKLRANGRLLILAGGLKPENVGEGIQYLQPDIVDVSSGVENDAKLRGKSREKILAFLDAVKAADNGTQNERGKEKVKE